MKTHHKCAEIRVRAERRMGEELAAAGVAQGRPKTGHDVTIKLADVGVSRKQSSRWQGIASIPDDAFEGHIRETVDKGAELASSVDGQRILADSPPCQIGGGPEGRKR